MMKSSVAFRALLASGIVALTACGGGGTPTAPQAPAPPPTPVATGVLTVTVSGLPNGTNASVTVTGPGNFSQTVTATTTINSLTAGTYTVAASNVSSGGNTYTAAPPTQTASVANGTTATTTTTYTAQPIVPPTPTGNDLAIGAMYITQGTQRLDGSIDLVRGRDAWIRVFVRGGNFSTTSAPVRVRFYQNGTLADSLFISAPTTIAPTNTDEGSPGTSWNIAIPGSRIQPGLSVLVDVDPANAVTETSETNNSFPVTGTPLALTVRTTPTMNIRMVPVATPSGLGDLTTGNAESYLTFTRAIWPVADISYDVRPVFNSADTAQLSGSGPWTRVLGELAALRTSEGSSAYYVGVVKSNCTGSCIAGIGYVPGSAQTSGNARALLTWDRVNSRSSVTAHELGHNFGRPHAPCGSTDRPDPEYPYSDGSIGIFGFDVARANGSPSGAGATGVIKPPSFTDLMGYCSNEWVSDFHYQKVLDWRTTGVTGVRVINDTDPVQPSLLVWGRMTPTGIELEPAVAVTTRPSRPSGTGTHLLELRDEAGTVFYSARFTPNTVDHGLEGDAQFNFAIPVSASVAGRLASVRVSGNGRQTEMRRAAQGVAAAARMAAGEAPGSAVGMRTAIGLRGQREARWNGEAFPFAIVRNARTGQIVGFARNGVAPMIPGVETELTLSDGVQSRTMRVTP